MGGTSRVTGPVFGPVCERACCADFPGFVHRRAIRLVRVLPGCAACRQGSGPAYLHRPESDSTIAGRDTRKRNRASMQAQLPTTATPVAGLGRNLTEAAGKDR